MVISDAGKALAIASSLKRLVNVEIKNFDVQQTGVSLTTVPVIIQLSNIPQGDPSSTISRDGAQCKVLAIEMGIQLLVNNSAASTSVRLLLICDKQTNQAIYVDTDLLRSAIEGVLASNLRILFIRNTFFILIAVLPPTIKLNL